MSYDLERPQSRTEEYLAFIAQLKSEYPDKPLSRVEAYLEYIAEHGGGGGADPAVRAMIAADYDATKTYAVGDFAIYNNKLYKALEETTGAFVPTAWEETSIDNELKNAASVWGNITGDMDDQTDLKNKFDYVEGEISNLKNIGRFCAVWNASTGAPTSEPTTTPYTYKVGDYFRIGISGYKVPTGSTYVPGAYDTVTEETGIGDVWYYDGTNWVKQASSGGGTVQDVQVAGTSVLSEGIANIPIGDGNTLGVVKLNSVYGIASYGAPNGYIYISKATDAEVTAKSNTYRPIVPANLQLAVDTGVKGSTNYTSYACEMADGTTKTLKLYSELV